MIGPVLLFCVALVSGKHVISQNHHHHGVRPVHTPQQGHVYQHGRPYPQGHMHPHGHHNPQGNPHQSGNTAPLIIGGTDATPGAWPWQVGLIGRNSLSIFCGGSLIQPNQGGQQVVLTAAHCVNGDAAEDVRVVLGQHNRRVRVNDRIEYVQQIIVHDDYDPGTLENDIAIIKLRTDPGNFNSDKIAPVSLPDSQSDNLQAPCDVTVTGWGTMQSGYWNPPTVLQEVTKPYVDDITCKAAYGNEFYENTMLCAGEGGKDACQGDSGGPLVYSSTPAVKDSYKLYGVVSWGYGCADPRYPGVYAKVSTYVDWIKCVVNNPIDHCNM